MNIMRINYNQNTFQLIPWSAAYTKDTWPINDDTIIPDLQIGIMTSDKEFIPFTLSKLNLSFQDGYKYGSSILTQPTLAMYPFYNEYFGTTDPIAVLSGYFPVAYPSTLVNIFFINKNAQNCQYMCSITTTNDNLQLYIDVSKAYDDAEQVLKLAENVISGAYWMTQFEQKLSDDTYLIRIQSVPYIYGNDANLYSIFYWNRDEFTVADTFWIPNEYAGTSHFLFHVNKTSLTDKSLIHEGTISLPNSEMVAGILTQNGYKVLYFFKPNEYKKTGTTFSFHFFNITEIKTVK
jgi:hypothetical protein